MFDQVMGGLGRVLEETGYVVHGKAGAGERIAEAQRVGSAWLLGRALRPRHINWPRLLVATAAGIVLGEVLESLVGRRGGRALPAGRSRVVSGEVREGGPRSARAAEAEEAAEAAEEAADAAGLEDGAAEAYLEIEVELEPEPGPHSARRARAAGQAPEGPAVDVRRFLERAGGDLAVAAAYASVVYPRIPGPPLLRAAIFGAADVAVAGNGGIAATLTGVSPRVRVPLRQLLSDEERRIERALALALALGLIYRDEPYDD
jgi:hypothetical protein